MSRHTWAERLEAARLQRRPIAPLTDAEPDLSIDDAYAIATLVVDARRAAGAAIVGHKIGLTSVAVQQQLGVDQPDYGALLSDMRVEDGATAPSCLIAPRVEPELAFTLADGLAGPGVTPEDVAAATATVQPAIEIVDSRIADWRIKLGDTVADNASSGAFVVGGNPTAIDRVDLAGLDVVLRRNGENVAEGNTSAVLGDPRVAVAWLANALARHGTRLAAGEVVLSGACTRMVDAAPGDTFVGDFGALGRVSVAFGGDRAPPARSPAPSGPAPR
jgi:2-keto-4-pentenoate hydratase